MARNPKPSVEMYVRHSAGLALFHVHLPAAFASTFIERLRGDQVTSDDAVVHLELSVLPEWVTDSDQRAQLTKIGPVHVRVPIAQIALAEG